MYSLFTHGPVAVVLLTQQHHHSMFLGIQQSVVMKPKEFYDAHVSKNQQLLCNWLGTCSALVHFFL